MISKDKEYRLDGPDCIPRIYATDGGGKYPVHGAIETAQGWKQVRWSASGEGDGCPNLIEVKPRIKRTVWLNVYEGDTGKAHESKDRADRAADCLSRVACVKVEIDCEEGEGL